MVGICRHNITPWKAIYNWYISCIYYWVIMLQPSNKNLKNPLMTGFMATFPSWVLLTETGGYSNLVEKNQLGDPTRSEVTTQSRIIFPEHSP